MLSTLSTGPSPELSLHTERSRARASGARTRVLLFTNSVAVGGMEEHVKLVARLLDRREFEVFAVAPRWAATRDFSEAMRGVADHFAEYTPDRRIGLWPLPLELARLLRQLRAWRIDVVHFHSTSYRGQALAMAIARLAGIERMFVTEHLAPASKLGLREFTWRNLVTRSLTGIVCVSEKNHLARAAHLYTPPGRTVVVENGVNCEDFMATPKRALKELRETLAIPANAEVVGTAVRFEPEKGLEYLLEAFVQIKAARPNAMLLMVGDGSLRASLSARCAELGIAGSVRWAGFQCDCRPYYSLMDAFVLPVPFGSMSIGLLEAMAMRCASVITFGGDGEAIVHGESGYCAQPRNPSSIAEYVIRILSDPEHRERIGRAARARVEAKFSAQRVARSLASLYRGVGDDALRSLSVP